MHKSTVFCRNNVFGRLEAVGRDGLPSHPPDFRSQFPLEGHALSWPPVVVGRVARRGAFLPPKTLQDLSNAHRLTTLHRMAKKDQTGRAQPLHPDSEVGAGAPSLPKPSSLVDTTTVAPLSPHFREQPRTSLPIGIITMDCRPGDACHEQDVLTQIALKRLADPTTLHSHDAGKLEEKTSQVQCTERETRRAFSCFRLLSPTRPSSDCDWVMSTDSLLPARTMKRNPQRRQARTIESGCARHLTSK